MSVAASTNMLPKVSVVRCAMLVSIGAWLSGISRNADSGFITAQKSPANVSFTGRRQLARAPAAPLLGATLECPADQYERAEAKAFEDVAFSLQHPPPALVEDRAKELASIAATAATSGRNLYNASIHAGLVAGRSGNAIAALLHPGACCNPSAMNVHEAVARGLLAPQPTPGQTASAAALAAEAHARAVAVALQRGRPVNIVGAWSPAAEAQAAAGLESGGASWKESPSSRLGGGSAASGGGGSWHYDAASPCDAPTAIDRTLSFAKSAAVFSSASSSSSGIEGGSGVSSGAGSGGSTGCARYAVAVGGDLGHFGNSLGSFEENVVNAAHGDVDVFFYVSLDSPNGGGGNAGAGDGSGRSGNGGKLRGEQVKLLRLLKKDYGPKQKAWAIAAVVEAASNATTRETLMDQCFTSADRSGAMNSAEPASPTCGGSPVEIMGDTLEHLRFDPPSTSNTKPGRSAAAPTLEAQDAACCAACRHHAKCEFWVRNAHGDCWLKRDAAKTQPSGQRRSGVLRSGGGRTDPLSRLSRTYGTAYATSPLGENNNDGVNFDPLGWCGKGCGTTCWRERFMDELWASRQRYLAAKLVARHAARHGCSYDRLLLTRPDVIFHAPVPWDSPRALADQAATAAARASDVVLAQRLAAAQAATQRAQQLRAQFAKDTKQAAQRQEQESAEAAADAAAEAAAFQRRRSLQDQPQQHEQRRELQQWARSRSQNNKQSASKPTHDRSRSTNQKSGSHSSSSTSRAITSALATHRSNALAVKDRQAEIASAEAKAETLRNAVRRPPDVITDRPYLKAAKPGSTKQAAVAHGAMYTNQQLPLVFFSEAKPNRGFGSRGAGNNNGYRGARFVRSFAYEEGSVEARAAAEFRDQETVSVTRDSQRRFGPTTTRCAQGLGSSHSSSSSNFGAHGVALGQPTDTFALAALYRDFGSWWSLAAPRRVEGCSYGVGGRLVVLQLNWRVVWWRDLSFDFTPHWHPRSSNFFSSSLNNRGDAFRGPRGNSGLRGTNGDTFERQAGSGPFHEAQMQRDDDWSGGRSDFGSGGVDNGQAFARRLLDSNAISASARIIFNNVSAPSILQATMIGDLPYDSKTRARCVINRARKAILAANSSGNVIGRTNSSILSTRIPAKTTFLSRRVLVAPSRRGTASPSSDITGLNEARFGKFTWAQWRREAYAEDSASAKEKVPQSSQLDNNSSLSVDAGGKAAKQWWAKTVPAASKASPPKAGKHTLVFLHVPKTGGTTISDLFIALARTRPPLCWRRYMWSFVKTKPDDSCCPAGAECESHRSDLLFGHNSWDPRGAALLLQRQPVPTSLYYAVFLRDPLERMVSFANFNEVPRVDFQQREWPGYAYNAMTSMVNGVIGIGPGVGAQWAFSDDPRTCAYDRLSADGPAAALAQWNLVNSFTFVGDTGRFAESVWLMQRTFGWGEPMALSALSRSSRNFHRGGRPRHGYTPWKVSDLPLEFVKKDLATAEACDVALYEYARELVASRLANMPAHNLPALKRFLTQAKAQDQAQLAISSKPVWHSKPHHSNNMTKGKKMNGDGENDVSLPFKMHQKDLIREKRKHQKADSSNTSAVSTSENEERASASRVLKHLRALGTDHAVHQGAYRLLTRTDVVIDNIEANERTGFNATAWHKWLAAKYNSRDIRTHERSSSRESKGNGARSNVSVDFAAAHEWWSTVVQQASKASPPRANKATLVFLHVPKTGGTTLTHMFDALVLTRPPLCWRRYLEGGFRPAGVKPFATSKNEVCGVVKGDLMFGHNSWDPMGAAMQLLRQPKPASLYYAVFLRDPVERMVSFANFYRVERRSFESGGWRAFAVNAMTSMVNGVLGVGAGTGEWYAFPSDPRTCAHDHLSADGPAAALAQWNLAHSFTFVGDTGRFAESVWLMQRTFGWGEPMALSALSRSAHNFHMNGQPRHGYALWSLSDLRPAFVNELAAAEACDVALYGYARELMASRLANMPNHEVPALKRFLRQAIAHDQAQLIPSTSSGHTSPSPYPNDVVEKNDRDVDSSVAPSRAGLKHQKELIREKRKHQKAGSSSETLKTGMVAGISSLEAEQSTKNLAPERVLLNTASSHKLAVANAEANERTGFNATAWRMWLTAVYNNNKVTKPQQSKGARSNVSVDFAAAHEWWSTVVQQASKASPPRANKATLVFLHVPKTGGTTLTHLFDALVLARPPLCWRRYLERGFRPAESKPFATSKNQPCGPVKGDLMFGHNSWDPTGAAMLLQRQPLPESLYYAVFLRDPVERMVSFANFYRVERRSFESGGWRAFAVNAMTSMVNGVLGVGAGTGEWYAFPSDPRTCAHDHLSADGPAAALAQWNLAHSFTFVGDTGRFAESVWLMQRTFGWGEPMALSALSRSSRGFAMPVKDGNSWKHWNLEALSPKMRPYLATAEACDMALYNYAQGLVAARLQVLSAKDTAAVARFLAKANA